MDLTEITMVLGARADIDEAAYQLLLATHSINAVMGSVTQYHCEKCGMEFSSLSELNYHQISKHSNVPDSSR
jgi:hypothetical protein